MRTKTSAAVLGGLLASMLPFAAAEAAFVDGSLYCDGGGSASVSAAQLSLDVGAGSTDASDCYGAFGVKEAKTTLGTNSEMDVLRALWGDDLIDVGKWEGSDVALNVDLGGLVITGIQTTGSGWSISWVANPADTLPANVTLAVILKAGSAQTGGNPNRVSAQNGETTADAGSWLFDSLYAPFGSTGGSGTFAIGWTNGGGQIATLSHLTLAAFLQPLQVAEPGTVALLAGGLLGLGALRRRRRA